MDRATQTGAREHLFADLSVTLFDLVHIV
jgi:hypothetical protein